jgi:aminopeptidase N
MTTPDTNPRRPWPGVLTHNEARHRAAVVSNVSYAVALDLTGGDELATETVVNFEASGSDRETFLDYAGLPLQIVCNGVRLGSDCFDGTRITIPIEAGENEVRISALAAYGRAGVGMHRFVDPIDGQVYIHTKFQPFDAHRVFPCFDQPDLRAPFDVEVTAPSSWSVIANGEVVDRVAVHDGVRRWRFERTPPLPTYLTAIAAGSFERVSEVRDGVPITLYARPSLMGSLRRDAAELFDTISGGLTYFTGLFGHPYPFGAFDVVFAPEYTFGAMEHPGAVIANERFLFTSRVTEESRRRRSEVLLHEIAHMWFGNLVTPRWWDDLWLSESFAVWAAATAQADSARFAGAWVSFVHDDVVTARRADDKPDAPPVAVDVPDTLAARMTFNPITYRKGAALLRQLSGVLGEDRFRLGVVTLRPPAGCLGPQIAAEAATTEEGTDGAQDNRSVRVSADLIRTGVGRCSCWSVRVRPVAR